MVIRALKYVTEVWMGGKAIREKTEGRELKLVCVFSMILLLLAGIVGIGKEGRSLGDAVRGLWVIIISRDTLITDYFELVGYGASFFNGLLVIILEYWMLCREKMKFTGLTMAAFFINIGYAFWGKNPVNILPILLGSYLYARLHNVRLGRYIYTALFANCLSPLVTELVFMLPFQWGVNLLIAVGTGILIGFLLPSLSMHTASMHMGYSLFNVGFSAGILAFALVCILKAFGIQSETVMIWRASSPLWIVGGLYLYFLLVFLFGLYLERGDVKNVMKIWRHPGRAVTDFVLLEGAGSTLMNMSLVGMICTVYICLVGGDFSGPVVGAILSAFGFSAFGAHVKNYVPVLAGVFLSTFLTRFEPTTPGMQLAAVFAVGLSPVAGQFGPVPGVLAGMLHAVIVMCTSQMYGGLNLYNNGFSTAWVAIILVPALESFQKEPRNRKRRD